MSTAAHSVSFSDDILSASSYGAGPSSSPSKKGNLLYASSNGTPDFRQLRSEGLIPLAPAKTVLSARRGVIFSPREETKYFSSSDPIIPSSKDPPPASIRSYANSDPFQASSSSPLHSPSYLKSTPRRSSETPSIIRSILKQRVQDIRVASSVEEGTLNNKEPARLLVSGKRPRLVARDSFQLAMIRKAASESAEDGELEQVVLDKGKSKEEHVGSDDSISSDDFNGDGMDGMDDRRSNASSSEEEEEIEEAGEMAFGGLIRTVVGGADDLLSVEEAYTILMLRLRERIPLNSNPDAFTASQRESIRLVTQPIRDEAPAFIRAIQRDLLRLQGKISEHSGADETSFRHLQPIRDPSPTTHFVRPTPSPSPNHPNSKRTSPDKTPRQGYTESEVRYRREASGVGAAALRFLALTCNTQQLWTCFSEADLIYLLDQVTNILRTLRLPTPNVKRTYFLAILVLSQIRAPASCLLPLKEKMCRGLESIFQDISLPAQSQVPGGGNCKDVGAQIKKEAYQAVLNLMSTYPSLFFQHYAELLPHCLRGMTSPSPVVRNKASTAAASFAARKFDLMSDHASPEEWSKNKVMVLKCENFVAKFLKSASRASVKNRNSFSVNAEKKTEWMELEKVFKDTMGQQSTVLWACSTWAVVVSLLGSCHGASGLAAGPTGIDHIIDRSLQVTTNQTRPPLARAAWYHAIHAYLSSGHASSISENGGLVQSFAPFSNMPIGSWEERLRTIQLPLEYALGQAHDSSKFKRVLVEGRWEWQREEKARKLEWLATCVTSSTAIIYAYTGMAIHHRDQPAKEMTAISGLPSSDGPPIPESEVEEAQLQRLDKTWDRVVKPMIKSMTEVSGLDVVKLHAWDILNKILDHKRLQISEWSLNRLLSSHYLSGDAFTDKEGNLIEYISDIRDASVQTSEIPAFGANWVASRLDKVLDMFQDIISTMGGTEAFTGGLRDSDGFPILAKQLMKMWRSILFALSDSRGSDVEVGEEEDEVQKSFSRGLRLVLRHLLQIYNRDPASHVPLAHLTADGRPTKDADSLRLQLFKYLLDQVIDILGESVVGSTRVIVDTDNTVDTFIAKSAFGADDGGQATMAGSLLGQLLMPIPNSLTLPLNTEAQSLLKEVVAQLLDVEASGHLGDRLIGDMTSALPGMFEQTEDLRLDIWRILAARWPAAVARQSQNGVANAGSTGDHLLNLLSFPFEAASVDSVWYQQATTEDLELWTGLLITLIGHCKAQGVDTNQVVFETLASRLGQSFEAAEKTSSSTITLSCLAAAVLQISPASSGNNVNQSEANRQYTIPVHLLGIISNALLESYPSEHTQSLEDVKLQVISPTVPDLIQAIKALVVACPVDRVLPIIRACQPGLVTWLADTSKLADNDLAKTLDEFYITVLANISASITEGKLEVSPQTLDDLLEIYAPRLSRAQSLSVPLAFQSFYAPFTHIRYEDVSEQVQSFLSQLLAAVPGIINVPGLVVEETLSEEESQARYPHAIQARPPHDASEILVDATEINIDPSDLLPDPAEAYDADISQSETAQPVQASGKEDVSIPIPPEDGALDVAAAPEESLVPEKDAVETKAASALADVGGDVFGPTAAPKPRKIRNRRKGISAARSKAKKNERASLSAATESSSNEAVDQVAQDPAPASKATTPVSESTSGSQGNPIEIEEDEPVKLAQALVSTSSDLALIAADVPPGIAQAAEQTSSSNAGVEETSLSSSRDSAQTNDVRAARTSLFTSARGWLSRVPSFGLFSPTNPQFAEQPTSAQQQPNREQTPSPKSVSAHASTLELDRTIDVANKQPGGKSSRRATKRSKRGKKRRSEESVSGEAASEEGSAKRQRSEIPETTKEEPVDVEAEDDELLLSPESARKRKREEERAIQQARLSAEKPIRPMPSLGKTRSKTKMGQTEETSVSEPSQPSISSGQFDDAPESSTSQSKRRRKSKEVAPQTPLLPVPEEEALQSPMAIIPPSPAVRSRQQTKVLSMIEEAARAKTAVESLDFDGVLALMRNVETLRTAALKNLQKRAEEDRAAKRARRGGESGNK